uniref:Uncharacterized protein n=1 Tax=Hyaloperonospora arabidopsidis (strain Emoy2) TaxID=559515 RepID=M4BMJ7_HYAAE
MQNLHEMDVTLTSHSSCPPYQNTAKTHDSVQFYVCELREARLLQVAQADEGEEIRQIRHKFRKCLIYRGLPHIDFGYMFSPPSADFFSLGEDTLLLRKGGVKHPPPSR